MGESSRTVESMAKSLSPVSVHFLGTCSGGGPILSRNCSSLAVDFGAEIWLFDAADATLQRLHQSSLRMANISRIFITHLHADHVLGLVAIMTTIMSGVGNTPEALERLRQQGTRKSARLNIYGPRGLRELIRTTLRITSANLSGAYAVHELLTENMGPSVTCREEDLYVNEAVGQDFDSNEDGVWESFLELGAHRGGKGWGVSAGPIVHRVPSLGYILQEPPPQKPLNSSALIPLLKANAKALAELPNPIQHPLSLLSYLTSYPPPEPYTLPSGDVIYPPGPSGLPGRKILIFGDCSGGTRNPVFQRMCEDPSLLIHECTRAWIPAALAKGEKGRRARVDGLAPSLVVQQEKLMGHVMGAEEVRNDQSEKNGESSGYNGTDSLYGNLTEDEREAKAKVVQKALDRGHSSPDVVGEFAKAIRARRVVVNHFSAMFPCPRYASSEPYPPMLSPVSPFRDPSPTPLPHSKDPAIPPLPLFARDLHLRIIMQSIADQITRVWCSSSTEDESSIGSSNSSSPLSKSRNFDPSLPRLAVAARDFMVYTLTSHEMGHNEIEVVQRTKEESERVMKQWIEDDGIWVDGKWLSARKEKG